MNFNDAGWLGEGNERFGPAARAAAGLLLKRNGWEWYYLRSTFELEQALSNVIPGHGIAVWGGDEAVLSIDQWLDPFRAIAMGRAFHNVTAYHDLRVRISREVWEWQTFANAPELVRMDLSLALADGRVFYDWPKDRRPPRGRRIRDEGKVVISSPAAILPRENGNAFAEAIGDAIFELGVRQADIVVANSVAELLAADITADVLIVIEDDPRAVTGRLDQLRVEKAARCVVRVPRSNAREWLDSFGTYWSQSRASVDMAIAFANSEHNLQAELVAANQTFVLQSGGFLARDWRERNLSDSGFVDVSGPRHAADSRAPQTRPVEKTPLAPPPSKRVLDAIVHLGKRRINVLPAAGQLRIEVAIKPKTPSTTSRPDFPDHLIKWKEQSRSLQVHMVELDGEPITRELVLPRRGSSNVVEFGYEVVPQKALDLRLMVCDGPQILQTSRLQAKPGETIQLLFEADFTSLEREKRDFDLALMINDSLGGRPSATVLSPEGVTITAFDTGEIGTLRDEARTILETVVTNPAIPLQSALLRLADIGSRLLDVIRDEIGNWPADLERIQLSTKDNAFFPLEFFYDGIVPRDPAAPLCSHFKSCLLAGDQGVCCATHEEPTVLCPLGFLGLRTIIERQVWSDETQATLWLRQSAELSSRDRLSAIRKIAFAASDTADDFANDSHPSSVKLARIQSIIDELAPRLETWDDWLSAVKNEELSMALLIAHIDESGLYIGANQGLTKSRLEFGTVPVAILLGCKSAIGPVASLSLPSRILRKGHTRVVVSALTDILGRHANTAALYLGKQIRDASNGATPVPLGEFVLRIRRELLANDVAAGLVLVALGDADIALGA
ncbi:hypothetical protein [Nitratireductor indicus]|uniref:hypothetical protein n=1 Tax=Nitratireductor indicus TaxID=721133 RepID=UPI002875037A|nr:hypothetical protein [Nitratireductor indicus]MDS1135989.1 hypothetical protein [Nitratireductor indicus]